MPNVLTRRLEALAPLSVDDGRFLNEIIKPGRLVKPHAIPVSEGQNSDTIRLVVSGLACRFKMLSNGKRQIVGYVMPGEFCDLNTLIHLPTDHSIAAVTECVIIEVSRKDIEGMMSRQGVRSALWRMMSVEQCMLREWVLNIGKRSATQRLAYLFCELHLRSKTTRKIGDDDCRVPLTQDFMADTIGLSLVHVNRCVQQLKAMDLVSTREKTLMILDLDEIIRYSEFKPQHFFL